MLNNQLTYEELDKIIKPIITLENIDIIKERVYSILKFTPSSPSANKQYFVNRDTTGVNSTYKQFEIEIRKLSDPKNDFNGVIIQFKKQKRILDDFINPTNRLLKDLRKILDNEFTDLSLSNFDPGGKVIDGIKESYHYHLNALNPNWQIDNKLSPLVIYTREDYQTLLIEFTFSPECYERTLYGTSLKVYWRNFF
ncbi:hypothetical protein QWZ08_16260 [Ferruginibacter paludis]|uniref:hypothetical protein n=1 Tax=Ferruginibacter paludis TaxID=1310417 RepID=UPI0025B50CD2|nr:hypothetical protein [Ferruginibacter paludis]MDN3657204.1 hypothetical protein [Ferruginibacter paludis]